MELSGLRRANARSVEGKGVLRSEVAELNGSLPPPELDELDEPLPGLAWPVDGCWMATTVGKVTALATPGPLVLGPGVRLAPSLGLAPAVAAPGPASEAPGAVWLSSVA